MKALKFPLLCLVAGLLAFAVGHGLFADKSELSKVEREMHRQEEIERIGPVNMAIYADDLTALKDALEAGEDPNQTDSFGNTPLFTVVSLWEDTDNTLGMIHALIDFGASVNHVNNIGMTPLHWVAGNGGAESEAMAKALVDAGADPSLETKFPDGNAYELALKEGNASSAGPMQKHANYREPANKAELKAEGVVSKLMERLSKTEDEAERKKLANRIVDLTLGGDSSVSAEQRAKFLTALLYPDSEEARSLCDACP